MVYLSICTQMGILASDIDVSLKASRGFHKMIDIRIIVCDHYLFAVYKYNQYLALQYVTLKKKSKSKILLFLSHIHGSQALMKYQILPPSSERSFAPKITDETLRLLFFKSLDVFINIIL